MSRAGEFVAGEYVHSGPEDERGLPVEGADHVDDSWTHGLFAVSSPTGCCGPGEIEQVLAFGAIELEDFRDRVEN